MPLAMHAWCIPVPMYAVHVHGPPTYHQCKISNSRHNIMRQTVACHGQSVRSSLQNCTYNNIIVLTATPRIALDTPPEPHCPGRSTPPKPRFALDGAPILHQAAETPNCAECAPLSHFLNTTVHQRCVWLPATQPLCVRMRHVRGSYSSHPARNTHGPDSRRHTPLAPVARRKLHLGHLSKGPARQSHHDSICIQPRPGNPSCDLDNSLHGPPKTSPTLPFQPQHGLQYPTNPTLLSTGPGAPAPQGCRRPWPRR